MSNILYFNTISLNLFRPSYYKDEFIVSIISMMLIVYKIDISSNLKLCCDFKYFRKY